MARVANLCDTVTQRLLLGDPGLQGQGPRPQVPVPTYTGYDDRKSVADFLAELAAYKLATGASDDYVLARVLPAALQASAARWWRIVAPFLTWEDFRRKFQDEFLPPGYQSRVQRELERRTQHPDETLVEYVRVMQELFDRACPTTVESDRVARVVQQSHPRFHPTCMAAPTRPSSTWPGTLAASKRRSWPSSSTGHHRRLKKPSCRPVPGQLPGPEEVRLSANPRNMARSFPPVRWTPTLPGNGIA
ncbi:unnamed protein product, partial [Ixodes hexagonus]